MTTEFEAWWEKVCRSGDMDERPRLIEEAFNAGMSARAAHEPDKVRYSLGEIRQMFGLHPEKDELLRAPIDGPFEVWFKPVDGTRGVLDDRNGITLQVFGFVDDNEHRNYCEELANTLNARTAHEPCDALALAIRFHEAYERLAPSFGYETRPDTRAFDPESKNGRLMVAVCAEIGVSQPPLEQRPFGAVQRLHNICDALGEQADESPFTREEWERIDKETVELQSRNRSLKAEVSTLREHLAEVNRLMSLNVAALEKLRSTPPPSPVLEYERCEEHVVECRTCGSTFIEKAAEQLKQRLGLTKGSEQP